MPAVASAQPTGYQEYYVLGYEEHIWRAFLSIYEGPDEDIPGRICSTVSLVATADYQVIYYDHWEDGYEANLFNPVQSTTEVYGDGNLINGGVGRDILFAGDDVNLTSDQELTGPTAVNGYVPVEPARDPVDIRYDGGDRIITSGGPVDLAHAMWPLENSWIGGAWEVYSRQAYVDAYSYRLPIGEDLYSFGGGDTGIYGDFRNVYLQLGAFEDNTTVMIDNGVDRVNLTLDRGLTYFSMGYINSRSAPAITINSGTTIRSNRPIQVGLATGADSREGDGFQGRFLIVLSDLLWGADYVVPVPSGELGDRAEVYLANPNDFPITISAYDAVTQTTFVVSSSTYISSTVPYSQKRDNLGHLPEDSALRFTSSDGVFGVVVAADTSDVNYDWGFSGIPAKYLTRDYYVSWAPGTTDLSDNGSPVWVTPLADGTTFYVDFSPLDGIVDEAFTLDVLQQRRVFDPDNDNTGTHIWATSEFAMTWGEDPRTAGLSTPYLDLGLTTLPLLQRWLDPVLTLDKTASPTILPSAGGTVTFTLVAHSYNAPLANVDMTDTLPINWTYVPNSTHVIYPTGGSGSPEPMLDGRTLFWDLSTDLDVNHSMTLTFQAEITSTGGVDLTAYDGFESGTFSGGANWANDWQEGGDDDDPAGGDVRIVVSDSPFAGNRHLQIRAANNAISRTLDLGDFVLPTLHFVHRVEQLESGDYFCLDVHDGSSWTTILTWTEEDLQGAYMREIVDLAPYASSATSIRFRSGSTVGAWDYFYVDQIEVYDRVAVGVNRGEALGKDEYSQTLFRPTDEATVYISPLNLVKSVSSARAEIGDTLVYTLAYDNLSAFTAVTNVTLRDAVPIQYFTLQSISDGGVYHAASGSIIWTLGTLSQGASGFVTFTVKVNHFVEDGTILKNVGYLHSDQTQAGSNEVRTAVLAPDIDFSKLGPNTAAQGQVITYTLLYQNAGSIQATGVVISDTLPPFTSYLSGSLAINTGNGWVALSDATDGDQGAYVSPTLVIAPGVSAGVIAPGESGQIRFSAQIAEDVPSTALVLNSATIDRDLDIPRDSNAVVTRISDLLLYKTAEQETVAPGGVISYTLTFENVSQTVAQTNVYVCEPIPSFTSFVADSAYGADQIEYSWNNGVTWSPTLPITPVTHLRWYDAVLPASAHNTVGFAVQVNDTLAPHTTIQNMARITSTESATYFDEWIPSNTVQVATVDLWVEKQANRSTAQAGDPILYTILCGNHGTADAFGVRIADTLPLSTTYVAGSIWGPGADDSANPVLAWDVMTVTAGASAQSLGYAVFLDNDLSLDAVITNTAALSSAYGLEMSDAATTIVTGSVIYGPALKLIKSGPVSAGVDDTAVFTFTVTHDTVMGDGSAVSTVIVTDDVAGPASYVSGDDGDGLLEVGETWVYTAGYVIQAADPALLVNIGTVQGQDKDGDLVRACDTHSTVTFGEPILSLHKEVNADPVAPGELFSYTLSITNSGRTAHNLVVSDVVPADTSFAGCAGSSCALVDDTVVWGPIDLPGLGTGLDLTLFVTVSEGLPNGWLIVNEEYSLVAEDAPLLSGPPVTTTVSVPILNLSKRAFVDQVYTGSRLDYALLVSNSGGSANRLVVSDTLPSHTVFGGCDCTIAALAATSGSALQESDFCGAPFTCGMEGDQVVWRVDGMAGGRSLQMTFWVTVASGLPDGTLIVNDDYAAVADHFSPVTGSPPVTTTVRQLLVSVSKTAWPNPAKLSQQLFFTITVRNEGRPLESVAVTDILPSGVSYVDCAGALCGLSQVDGPEVRWWLPTLPANSERELSVRVTVDAAQDKKIVNELYSAWIPAAQRRVTGDPVVVLVEPNSVYLPLVMLDYMP